MVLLTNMNAVIDFDVLHKRLAAQISIFREYLPKFG